MDPIYQEALEQFDFTRALRRDLHRHPELGFKEVRTAGIITTELHRLGLEVRTGVAETGVVALMEGAHTGPTVLLRFDMDALPIQEETGAEYASETPGVMHACGHDGHVAAGLSVARLLHRHRREMNGSVIFVFQPAEEGLGGAERMIAAGALQGGHPQTSLALHFWNEKPLGWLGIPSGPLMAGADIFSVRVHGKGGHGAAPHRSVDPVVCAAQIITSLQTIASRNVSPLESAVVTVARLRAGEAYNVIPQSVELSGTIRAFDEEVHEMVLRRMEEIVSGLSRAMGCEADVSVQRLTPAVVNDADAAERVRQAASRLFPDHQVDDQYRTMVSEDMAFFMQAVPGCYFLVGSANPARGLDYGHHHPQFDIDEQALPVGIALMTRAALDYLA